MDRADPIIGIDLGTTNSVVAISDERGPRVLVPDGKDPYLPSVVRFEDDRTVVGADARDRAPEFPLTTISSAKRLLGRSRADVADELPFLGYGVVAGEHDTARIELPGEPGAGPRVITPQEVSAEVLRALRARAEAVLGHPVSRAVVTVPAYFDDTQRQATRDAGRLAGLDVVRLVNEPTAAALAYGLGLERDAGDHTAPRTVAVYDLGGGTFDISILRITPGEEGSGDAGPGEPAFYQVLSTAGDTHLGGDDIDHALVTLFVREIRDQLGLNRPAHNDDDDDALGSFPPATRRALVAFARSVKHRLSDEQAASISIAINETTTYDRTITRDELESIMAPWVEQTRVACRRALRDAKRELRAAPLDAVVMVGGSTRVPMVRAAAMEIFGLEPYTAIDPDLVVGLGAAVQGAILSGAATGRLLMDVIPLSLGIETVGGAVAKLIVRNSTVPARATEMFSTSKDNQTGIVLNVLQGEREMASDCRSLGTFEIKGLPPMPAGIPQLEVAFAVDANGVLAVSAHERRSGKRAELQIVPNHGLTRDEVDRIEHDSVTHAREDMQRHRVVDLVTNSELDLKWIGERLERHRGALDAPYAQSLDEKIAALRRFVADATRDWSSVDADAFYAAKTDLDNASVRLQEVGIAESLRNS